MKTRYLFAIIAAKIAIRLCRLLKWGGTSFPGKLAQKLYPDITKKITEGFNIIMVTGTNGKTTTTRIIGQILRNNGINFITNKSGANLISGIITMFIENVNFKGRSDITNALIEIDEAAFNAITNFITPDVLVVTNFFRDQLDRYGELYTTLKGVASGIAKSKNARLVLNADDSLCASLGRHVQNEVLYYGFDPKAYFSTEEPAYSDARFCIFCKTRYEYDGFIYGHLGWFRCPACGYERPLADVACVRIEELKSSHSVVQLRLEQPKAEGNSQITEPVTFDYRETLEQTSKQPKPSGQYRIYNTKINLPGLYNIYNALAAIGLSKLLQLDADKSIAALANFECGFGRMEVIDAGGKSIKIILVKNPTGFNQVLNYLLTETQHFRVAFLINDNKADGTDISWLWDVDFEKLQESEHLIEKAYASGLRAEDMAIRLKYSGFNTAKIAIEKDYGRLIEEALAHTPEGHSLYILPTYTAMLDVRKLLKKKYKLKDFWM